MNAFFLLMQIFILQILLSGAVFSGTMPSPKSQVKEVDEFRSDLRHTVYSTQCGDIHDRVICIDGFKVFQSVVYGFCDNGGGAAVSNIQLYEEKEGKVVPATCVPGIPDP